MVPVTADVLDADADAVLDGVAECDMERVER
jgi:hypothetical protein